MMSPICSRGQTLIEYVLVLVFVIAVAISLHNGITKLLANTWNGLASRMVTYDGESDPHMRAEMIVQ